MDANSYLCIATPACRAHRHTTLSHLLSIDNDWVLRHYLPYCNAPSSIVTLLFPPLLLIDTLWQARMIYRYHKLVPRYDLNFAYMSQLVFVFSLVSAWIGYTMFAVQVIIWWSMQLACILTIAFFKDYLNQYRAKHPIKKLIAYKGMGTTLHRHCSHPYSFGHIFLYGCLLGNRRVQS